MSVPCAKFCPFAWQWQVLSYRPIVDVEHIYFILHPGLMMIFPFLPFMIHDFFPELSRQELGKSFAVCLCVIFFGYAYKYACAVARNSC